MSCIHNHILVVVAVLNADDVSRRGVIHCILNGRAAGGEIAPVGPPAGSVDADIAAAAGRVATGVASGAATIPRDSTTARAIKNEKYLPTLNIAHLRNEHSKGKCNPICSVLLIEKVPPPFFGFAQDRFNSPLANGENYFYIFALSFCFLTFDFFEIATLRSQ